MPDAQRSRSRHQGAGAVAGNSDPACDVENVDPGRGDRSRRPGGFRLGAWQRTPPFANQAFWSAGRATRRRPCDKQAIRTGTSRRPARATRHLPQMTMSSRPHLRSSAAFAIDAESHPPAGSAIQSLRICVTLPPTILTSRVRAFAARSTNAAVGISKSRRTCSISFAPARVGTRRGDPVSPIQNLGTPAGQPLV